MRFCTVCVVSCIFIKLLFEINFINKIMWKFYWFVPSTSNYIARDNNIWQWDYRCDSGKKKVQPHTPHRAHLIKKHCFTHILQTVNKCTKPKFELLITQVYIYCVFERKYSQFASMKIPSHVTSYPIRNFSVEKCKNYNVHTLDQSVPWYAKPVYPEYTE